MLKFGGARLLVFASALLACEGSKSGPEDGFETGVCVAGTCVGDLVCLSNVCVEPGGASSTTSASTSDGTSGSDGATGNASDWGPATTGGATTGGATTDGPTTGMPTTGTSTSDGTSTSTSGGPTSTSMSTSTSTTTGGPTCSGFGDACTSQQDCCGYPDTAVCVDFGWSVSCTDRCESGWDCPYCCLLLSDNSSACSLDAATCSTCGASTCIYNWCGTGYQNACDSFWNGDGECDCGCQFIDVDCW